ncbi:hypothetical protein EDD18DRAFT_1106961 [Armillaria luteobubalina]|uniref:Uncharacterized protein n=1 Tax=Armillaria luteobubalina TaxID=153913 RepID=A0AA39Q1K9_9AGAR|nr:hypothetical protein EDD18DRAFT_1106961 [Armillaria luteobubalina]
MFSPSEIPLAGELEKHGSMQQELAQGDFVLGATTKFVLVQFSSRGGRLRMLMTVRCLRGALEWSDEGRDSGKGAWMAEGAKIHLRPSASVPGYRIRYKVMPMPIFVQLFELRRSPRLLQPAKKASVRKGQQSPRALRFLKRQQLHVQVQVEAKETTGKRKKALDDIADDDKLFKQLAAKRRKSRESDSPPPPPPVEKLQAYSAWHRH